MLHVLGNDPSIDLYALCWCHSGCGIIKIGTFLKEYVYCR